MSREGDKDLYEWQLGKQRQHQEEYYSSVVRGARKAGLHPLAALGSPGYSAPPMTISGDSGGSVGFGGMAGYSPNQMYGRDKIDEQIADETLRGQKLQNDVVLVQLLSSINRLLDQPGVQTQPDSVTAGRDGLTAGEHQASTRFRFADGRYIDAASRDAALSTIPGWFANIIWDYQKYIAPGFDRWGNMIKAVHGRRKAEALEMKMKARQVNSEHSRALKRRIMEVLQRMRGPRQ